MKTYLSVGPVGFEPRANGVGVVIFSLYLPSPMETVMSRHFPSRPHDCSFLTLPSSPIAFHHTHLHGCLSPGLTRGFHYSIPRFQLHAGNQKTRSACGEASARNALLRNTYTEDRLRVSYEIVLIA